MQIQNFKRDFEILSIKENETIQEYSNRLMMMVNKIRLLEENLS